MYNIHTDDPWFEWDAAKGRENIRKHGVSFEEAATAFLDAQAIVGFDPAHSEQEDRFILLGMSDRLRILVVVHCYRAHENSIRLISARPAVKREALNYWN
jgi:hypothetical protein